MEEGKGRGRGKGRRGQKTTRTTTKGVENDKRTNEGYISIDFHMISFSFFWGGSPSLPSILLFSFPFSFPFSFSFTFPDFPFLPFLPESKDLTSCCTCVSGHDGITPTIFFLFIISGKLFFSVNDIIYNYLVAGGREVGGNGLVDRVNVLLLLFLGGHVGLVSLECRGDVEWVLCGHVGDVFCSTEISLL